MVQTLEICSPKLTHDGDASSTRRLKKPCLTPLRSTDQNPRCLFILPEGITCLGDVEKGNHCNDRDTLVSVSTGDTAVSTSGADTSTAGDKPFEEHGTVTTPVAKPSTFTTRRQRRARDTSSCNYSDFCDNDLSRQIEAMVLEVETAFDHRHVKKSEHIIATHLSSKYSITKKVKQDVLKCDVPSTPLKSTFEAMVKGKPIDSTKTSFGLLRRMFETQPGHGDAIPEMKPCDSLISLSSNRSSMMGTRSSSDFLSVLTSRKPRNMSAQSNAEWAIIE